MDLSRVSYKFSSIGLVLDGLWVQIAFVAIHVNRVVSICILYSPSQEDRALLESIRLPVNWLYIFIRETQGVILHVHSSSL